jgi:hypothetical protein
LVEVATWRLLASSISLFSVILLFMAVSWDCDLSMAIPGTQIGGTYHYIRPM